ncbi:MAG: hypothetical protein GVY17_05885 [Cyanobacteria bacterium]|nr:hypothetical protein [Cyanobacteria bacterium GSL.Bin21]
MFATFLVYVQLDILTIPLRFIVGLFLGTARGCRPRLILVSPLEKVLDENWLP